MSIAGRSMRRRRRASAAAASSIRPDESAESRTSFALAVTFAAAA
eukprot:CAMPEP_0197439298 /NCGR_PEP_ID=MMETSP1175-20131217/6075_1 /TAXON_ID=1003142 /ORGANISM="Triceratium dubium, Strain CCMP147" /LENGTH=44 /DNA_ID= /DNA_START= /DNA_END= /DNA_ORIENTATION=